MAVVLTSELADLKRKIKSEKGSIGAEWLSQETPMPPARSHTEAPRPPVHQAKKAKEEAAKEEVEAQEAEDEGFVSLLHLPSRLSTLGYVKSR